MAAYSGWFGQRWPQYASAGSVNVFLDIELIASSSSESKIDASPDHVVFQSPLFKWARTSTGVSPSFVA